VVVVPESDSKKSLVRRGKSTAVEIEPGLESRKGQRRHGDEGRADVTGGGLTEKIGVISVDGTPDAIDAPKRGVLGEMAPVRGIFVKFLAGAHSPTLGHVNFQRAPVVP
jgi:hypothetical protein